MTALRFGRSGRALLAATAVLALVSCGVPQDGVLRTVEAEDVPYRLLEQGAAPSPTPTANGPVMTVPRVYFTDQEDRLVPQRQPLDASGLEPVVAALLERLSVGPDEAQRSQGLGSALGPDVGLRLVHVVEGIAYIEIAPPEQSPAADRLPLGIGQIVLTVTSVEGVDLALLLRDGRPLEAPLPGGERTSRPLSPYDYVGLAATTLPSVKAQPTVSG